MRRSISTRQPGRSNVPIPGESFSFLLSSTFLLFPPFYYFSFFKPILPLVTGIASRKSLRTMEKSTSALFSIRFKTNASSSSVDTSCVTSVNNYFSPKRSRSLGTSFRRFSSNFRRIRKSEDFPSRRSHLSNKLFSAKHHHAEAEKRISPLWLPLAVSYTVFFFLSLPILDVFISFPRNINVEYVDIRGYLYADPNITHGHVVPLVCRKKIKRDSTLRLNLFV